MKNAVTALILSGVLLGLDTVACSKQGVLLSQSRLVLH